MTPRLSKEQVEKLSEDEVRQFIKDKLGGRIKRLPHAFWRCSAGKEHARIAIKYLIEEHLQLELEEVPKKLTRRTFKEVGLDAPLELFFEGRYFKALDFAYPGIFKPEQFTGRRISKERAEKLTESEVRELIKARFEGSIPFFPPSFWDCSKGKERARTAIKYLFEKHLRWSLEEIPEKVSRRIFDEAGLQRPLNLFFDFSYFKALDFVYLGVFKLEQFEELRRKKSRRLSQVALKRHSEELSESAIRQLIKARLEGQITTFPHSFWRCPEGKERTRMMIRYLIEEHLQLDLQDVPQMALRELFREKGIYTPIALFFDGSFFEALNFVYPGVFKLEQFLKTNSWISKEQSDKLSENEVKAIAKARLDGHLSRFPKNFWHCSKGKEHFRIAVKYLIEEHLQLPLNEAPTKVTNKTLRKVGLDRPLSKFFAGSCFKALDFIYPRHFKPEQFPEWKRKKARERPKGPFEERMSELSEYEVREIIKDKLEGIITCVPPYFWSCLEGKEHARIAIKYLIEEHLQLSLEEIPEKVSSKTFKEVGLCKPLTLFFGSFIKALDFVYPDTFKPWHFRGGIPGLWQGEEGKARALEATQEMLDALTIPFEEIPVRVTAQTFSDSGLGGMLGKLYDNSPYKAIDALYPDAFKPWEFQVCNFWWEQSIETAREATRWLIEEKLQLTLEEIGPKVRQKHFLKFGLTQMLKRFYDGSYFKALADAYPSRETY